MVGSGTLMLLLLATMSSAFAQDAVAPDSAVDAQATADLISTSISAVEARTDLDDETRVSVVEQLRNAEAQLQRRAAAESAGAAAIEFAWRSRFPLRAVSFQRFREEDGRYPTPRLPGSK